MITVTYTSIDGAYKRRQYKTIAAARRFAVWCVGTDATLGTRYAVDNYGIGKVTVQGCSLQHLFGREE
jgi:hypothetical protein